MYTGYKRQKKWKLHEAHKLPFQIEERKDKHIEYQDNAAIEIIDDVPVIDNYALYESEDSIVSNENIDNFMVDNFDDFNSSYSEETNISNVNKLLTARERILNWTINILSTLRLNVVSELLCELRSMGHNELPKTAHALLETKHHRIIRIMESAKGTDGEYFYFGIKDRLKKNLDYTAYKEDMIKILIHIDGMQIYKGSPK